MSHFTKTLSVLAFCTAFTLPNAAAQQEDPIEILKRVVNLMSDVDTILSQLATAQSVEKVDEIIKELEKLDQPPPPNNGGAGGAGGEGGAAGGGGAEGGNAGGEGARDRMGESIEQIEKLLDDAKGRAQGVADEIQRILDMPPQGGGGGGGGGQEQQGQGEGEKQDQSGQQQQDKIRKGEMDQNSGQDQKPQGQEPQDQQADKPYDPKDGKRPEDETKKEENPERDAWIARLPPKAREAVEMGRLQDVPPEYKELVELYFKLLSDRRDRGLPDDKLPEGGSAGGR